MPKRSYPFGENSFLPQLKFHVREKEVNTGVARNVNMKRVYGETEILVILYQRLMVVFTSYLIVSR